MLNDKKELTAAEITDWLMSNATIPPSLREVEESLESLVNKGIIETLWNEDGDVLYRLTEIGEMVAEAVIKEMD